MGRSDEPTVTWASGPTLVEGQVGVVYAAESGITFPVTATLMVGVSIPVLTTEPNGMPDKHEIGVLLQLQEQLLAELNDGVFVGRLTGGGRRELYFYTSPSTSLDEWLSTVRATSPEREFRTRTLQDPERAWYHKLRDEAMHAFADFRTLRALEKQGADLTKKHDLRFYLYFPTEGQAQAALGRLEAEGWAEYQGWAPEVRESGTPDSWLLVVTFIGYANWRVTPEDRLVLARVARQFGGVYDGWEASVQNFSP